MTIAAINASLDQVDQELARVTATKTDFLRSVGEELNFILDQIQMCDAAVASGAMNPAELQALIDRIQPLVQQIQNLEIDAGEKNDLLTRLRSAYYDGHLRTDVAVIPPAQPGYVGPVVARPGRGPPVPPPAPPPAPPPPPGGGVRGWLGSWLGRRPAPDGALSASGALVGGKSRKRSKRLKKNTKRYHGSKYR